MIGPDCILSAQRGTHSLLLREDGLTGKSPSYPAHGDGNWPNPLSSETRYWIESAAAGAFSFLSGGERLTTAQIDGEPVTTCASTYNAMMARGWVKEVF